MSNSSETKVIDSFEKRNFTDKIISEIRDFDIIEAIPSTRSTGNNFSSILDKKLDDNVANVATEISNTLKETEKEVEQTSDNGLTISEKISDIISDNLRDNEINNINIIANYLPKRKVREMLFTKYKIDNDEYVNEIYNMAFNKKWKEMDLEQWLNNPNNINRLFGSIKSQMNLKDKELAQKRRGLNQDSSIAKSPKVEERPQNNLRNKNEVQDETNHYEKNVSPISGLSRKDILAHNLINDRHLSNCVDLGFVRDSIYANKMDNKVLEVKLDNLKNEMKYIYIEEKLKENQIDLQTEKLKNHIDNKFGELFKSHIYSNNQHQKDDSRDNYYKKHDKGFDYRFDKYLNNHNLTNIIVDELKEDIFEKIALLDEKISAIEVDYKKTIEPINSSQEEIVDKVSSQIKFAFEEFDKRESLINEHLEETNEKLDEVIESIDEKISGAVNKFNNLNENLSKDLGIENQKIKSSLSNLSNQLNVTNKNIMAFANDLDNLKAYVYDKDNFTGSTSTISESFAANIIDQINESNKQIGKFSDELNELKALVNEDKFNNKINESIEKTINNRLLNTNEEISKLRGDFNNLLEEQKNNNQQKNNIGNTDVFLLEGSLNTATNQMVNNDPSFKGFLKRTDNSLSGFHSNKFVDDSKFDNKTKEIYIKNEAPILMENKENQLPNFDEIDALIKQSIEQLKSLNEVVELDTRENDQMKINDSINKLESIKEENNK